MKRYADYEPETVGEEFMLMLGRVEALHDYLKAIDGEFLEKKKVCAIMGFDFEKEENTVKELENYLENLYSDREKYQNWKHWLFGAIDFAVSAGLIGEEDERKLFKKYELI